MSIQTATDFVQRANEDEAIRKVARQRFSDIVNVGREHGYDFTHDEFRQAMQERKASGIQASSDNVCQCGPSKPGGDTVCQCGPEQCTSGDTTDSTVCQCGPEQCTTGDTTDSAVCQCGGPEQCTSGDTNDSTVCQCGS